MSVGDGGEANIVATLPRHPRLMERWLAVGGALLPRGVLPARDREPGVPGFPRPGAGAG